MKLQNILSNKALCIFLVLFLLGAQLSIEFIFLENTLRLSVADFLLVILCIPVIFTLEKRDFFELRLMIGILSILFTFFALNFMFLKGESYSWALVKVVGILILSGMFFVTYLAGKSLTGIESEKSQYTLLRTILIISVLVAVIGLVFHLYHRLNASQNNLLNIAYPQRLSGLLRNPNAYGFFLTCMIIFGLAALCKFQAASKRLIWLSMFVLLTCLFLTGSRGAMIAYAFVAIVTLVCHPKLISKLVFVTFMAVLVPVVIGNGFIWLTEIMNSLGVFGGGNTGANIGRAAHNLNPTYLSQEVLIQGADVGTIERLKSYKVALQVWLEHPIFGAGLGYYKNHSLEYAVREGSLLHNTGLWLLAETGIVGFGLVLLLLVYLFRIFWINRDNWICFSMGLILIAAVVMSQTSEIMYQRHLWIFLGFGFAVAVYHQKHKKAELI
ncbi:O-antigen ligase family protein [Curvivirga sp.]|uniref:O-antigen ligase family protein n=1 Tax=Curvivirga sp. TaxID=2856848 RepID=UPI003B5A53DC